MLVIPSWLMALACFAAMLAALARTRRDRRVDGYIGHAIALLWLGTVYALAATGWLEPSTVNLRAPVLLLVITVGLVHFLAARHVGGRRG